MRPLNEIIVHCTATRPEWWATRTTAQKVAEVRRWHVEDRGWKDIGYHYLIDRNGHTVVGRPLDQVGAHTVGKNIGTIGVSLFGGHGSSADDKFADHFTPEQDKALQALLVRLMKDHPTIKTISGHNQYASKACPGFSVPSWYAKARPQPAPVAPKVGFLAALAAFLRRLT
jgi:N-acetyl-anhydromuramyl-L-alanine amidase AmpD